MSPDGDAPRPRRERPLVAPGRERRRQPEPAPEFEPGPEPEPESEPPIPTVTTAPVGRPVVEFPDAPVEAQRDDHVEVAFEGPTRQSRLSIAFRILIAIPHFFVLILLLFAAQFAVVIAWFAALFTKRVPKGLAEFLSNAVQYQTRVTGYSLLLLTDRYPPFNTDSTEYAINVRTNPGEFNRAAVLFRFILLIPGYILSSLVLYGAMAVMALGWFLALVLGRLPTPLWQANAAALRYFARAYAFMFLLTAEQPKGLFGDKPPPGAGALFDGDVPDLPETPRITRLVLSKAARVLVGAFIAIAVLLYAATIAFGAFVGSQAGVAYDDLEVSQQRLEVSISEFDRESQVCAASNGGLQCLHAAAAELARDFDTFAADVAAIDFPLGYDPAAAVVIDDAENCATALRRMATAEQLEGYSAAFDEYQTHLGQLIADFNRLAYDLSV